ncbi:hypothetical protein HMPREF1401_00740 [Helicobacter pylori GAM120Ai]|uniref:Uncharacterized protein n=2 Tax=Helicobacter pylori TaxID=210 RepID=A0AAV3IF83_HELPX|nr:hypothetical protein HMPREF1391_00568 [Helicobacter pylori GAM100Ai]EMG96006.1 hypothetical protein HMPREF1401_00740 [Helicobacter pylori GAM120Ai]
MSLIAQLLLYFFEIFKDPKISRKNPLQKYLKNYKATPLDYTIVKLHIV